MSTSYATKTHDVFISFRGEDTRSNFTSHLHTALCNKQIETYIDYNLKKGDDVWPALAKAIQDSRLSIVVFSENYATSKWCLEELVKILKCRKDEGQVVVPVFYQIDPSHIRKQIGTCGEAFAKHERDLVNQHKVSKWKSALTKAANISGWDSRTHRDDSELIQNIVNDVLQKLHQRYPNKLKGLVGVDEKCRDIESIMKDAGAIGIWGMGGIGKTTLAKAIYFKHFPQYDSVCFLENVREQSTKLGLTYLRDKLLSNLLNDQIPTSNDVAGKMRVRSKKVFLVLDDVDSFEQLEYLCGERGDLGPNSRLIITTRYKQLLSGRVDENEIYAVETWEYPQSLHLFCLNAFKESHPQKGYEDLSARAVYYAGGVPLALKVLGLHLYRKSNEIWESALSKLKKYPNKKIQNVLQVSYDGLDKLEKGIFLDIAFFFKDWNKNDVIRILNARDFCATSGIDVLVDKALITISNGNRIQMHDLLQKMGLDIVREEYGGDLGRRSRLMDTEEVCDLLKNNKGTDAVKGITLDLSQIEEDLHLSADTFNKMTDLRYLEFRNLLGRKQGVVNLPTAFESFSDKLRYLRWDGYPLKSLPPKFSPKFLVDIRMPCSNVKELWQGMQDLVNLERIDLTGCKQLTKLPDLSRASKLTEVHLSRCESLCDLHPSVLSLDSLSLLYLNGCIKLKSLKSERHLRSLKQVILYRCSSLKEFSVSSDLIEHLDLSQTGVKILHSSIGRLINLKWLYLEASRLENIPDELCCLTSLRILFISNCIAINKEKLRVLFDGLRSLEYLDLKDCYNLSELPDNISLLSMLRELRLDGSSVERLPASIKRLQQLHLLSLQDCRKLQCLPELPPSIKELHANNLSELPDNISLLSMLRELRLDGSSVERFPASIKHLQKLYFLSLRDCRKLQCLPELPPSIQQLYADNCTSLVSYTAKKSIASVYEIDFSFKNCVKMDGHSFNHIMEEAMIIAFLESSSFDYEAWYNSFEEHICVRVCMPGSRVPRHFTYRTTQSFINIELPSRPNVLGFISSVVLSSPSPTMETRCEIICKCCLANGTNVRTTSFEFTADFTSDHVFVWYDHIYDFIINGGKVSFEFSVIGRHGGLIVMKECGVRLMYDSEFYSLLSGLEWNLGDKVELGVKFGLMLDLQHLERKEEMYEKYFSLLRSEWEGDESLISEFESGCRAILTAIEKESEKSNGESASVLGELEMEFDKKVELGLKLGLALDIKQLESEVKDCQSPESERGALFRAIVNEAQKSKEFFLESHSFSGELELEFDKKVLLGVSLGLQLDREQGKLKLKRLNRLWDVLLDEGLELEGSLKLEIESRRREVLTIIEKEAQKSNEFVFPPVP